MTITLALAHSPLRLSLPPPAHPNPTVLSDGGLAPSASTDANPAATGTHAPLPAISDTPANPSPTPAMSFSERVKQTFRAFAEGTAHAFRRLPERVKNTFQSWGERIRQGFGTLAEGTAHAFKNLPSRVATAFRSLGERIVSGFKSFGERVANGFKSFGERIASAFRRSEKPAADITPATTPVPTPASETIAPIAKPLPPPVEVTVTPYSSATPHASATDTLYDPDSDAELIPRSIRESEVDSLLSKPAFDIPRRQHEGSERIRAAHRFDAVRLSASAA